MLELKGISAAVEEKDIINDISINVSPSEIHLVMGSNGAGKSTFVRSILNQEGINRNGSIILDGEDISSLETFELARKGLFLAYQEPVEVPGVHMVEFLRTAHNLQHPEDKYDPWSFREIYDSLASKVGLDSDFGDRNLNEGFSGGEKKRSEILQMLILKPKYAFLDEIDSGLDIDSLQNIFNRLEEASRKDKIGMILISHNPNILEYLDPDFVHLMSDGEIKKTGDVSLIEEVLEKGYAS